MLNNKGPNMDPWGTLNKISSQEMKSSLKSEFILSFVCDLTDLH